MSFLFIESGVITVLLIMYRFGSTSFSESVSCTTFVWSFNSFWYLILLLFRIKFQLRVAYKSEAYKKACNVVLYSAKHEEITFRHGFIFAFIPCFIGVILSKKFFKKLRLWKNIYVNVRGGIQGWGVYRRGRNSNLHIMGKQKHATIAAFHTQENEN